MVNIVMIYIFIYTYMCIYNIHGLGRLLKSQASPCILHIHIYVYLYISLLNGLYVYVYDPRVVVGLLQPRMRMHIQQVHRPLLRILTCSLWYRSFHCYCYNPEIRKIKKLAFFAILPNKFKLHRGI